MSPLTIVYFSCKRGPATSCHFAAGIGRSNFDIRRVSASGVGGVEAKRNVSILRSMPYSPRCEGDESWMRVSGSGCECRFGFWRRSLLGGRFCFLVHSRGQSGRVQNSRFRRRVRGPPDTQVLRRRRRYAAGRQAHHPRRPRPQAKMGAVTPVIGGVGPLHCRDSADLLASGHVTERGCRVGTPS